MSSPDALPANDGGTKIAMSRALGAAFLSHQVQELERAVASSPRRGTPRGRGRGAGPDTGRGGGRRNNHRKQGSEDTSGDDQATLPPNVSVIVLDASVLVHAPAQVKRWCKDDGAPDLVVPLEVLNTLDLLKKGTSLLAQRARGASRLLESFVGSNTRLRVQRDDAFLLWDDVLLTADDADALPPPEWLRRTLCCACWETTHNSARGSVLVAVVDSSPTTDVESAGRFDVRADGTLVKSWVPRVGLRILPVKGSSAPPTGRVAAGNMVPEKPLTPEPISAPVTVPRVRGKLFDPNASDSDAAHPTSPRRVIAPSSPMAILANSKRGGKRPGSGGHGGPPRKPMNVVAVKEPVRVVRLLARGEKLDP
ncbi:hypothetical protein EXIGLDRAFT_725668 [Exidia glandulosa HHB12029]|uniref:PIN domain-containing protein n=1 Tax=Exidia glandulosa HHB12029 TaxID=1314781 RepID=A0A165Q7S9_EXIGL|nr:hypothetical protein EXIGLDRAFT_725668 [Exidia glandulosa HHB12029]